MKSKKQKIMLALQGGGAHTAYVWGVVDQLLERDDIEIECISGTSGGAMIAAVVAYGLSLKYDANGSELDDKTRRLRTRALLDRFWGEVSRLGDVFWNPYRFVANPLHPSWDIDGLPVTVMLNMLTTISSPYQFGLGPHQNPIAIAIKNCIDMKALHASDIGPALYVCATNVRTSQPQVFTKDEIELEHLLASACLPVVDQAIKIGTEYYWDGGYVADPALSPLIENHGMQTGDLVIVGVNPIVMESKSVPPNTAWKILDRINEITFNASLISELKRIHMMNKMLSLVPSDAPARQPGGELYEKREIFVHYVPPHSEMPTLGVASKSNTAYTFLSHLKSLGREVAIAWESGEIEGGGALLLGQSSDTNFQSLFIDAQHGGKPPLPAIPPTGEPNP